MSEETPEAKRNAEDRALIRKHVDELAEHWESVHIFVSQHEGSNDRSRGVNIGAGNWFARFGQIKEWTVYEEERIKMEARASGQHDGPTIP